MITKRQLALLFVVLGAAGLAGLAAVDWLGGGRFQGIGPTQRLAMGAAALLVVVGLSLLPLGDRPA